ncbi:DUF4124 domain-containing protein [Geotalea toluenoxydans]|uniref:DUF4124 domain-containing protein n=1 Tax=Geotalea toluenoxydans TaxID=421624 RepID=UPI0006D07640|nr:DUF4124 domain-containing protein [Geotalea toluenoxydans]
MKTLLVFSLLLFAVPAFAVTYEWTDERGTVNFTEDLGNVPKKYRKRVKILGAEEDSQPRVIETDNGEKGKTTAEEGQSKVKEDVAGAETKKKPAVYGGKNEAAWKAEYGKLSADVKAAEEQLDHLNGRLGDTTRMSRAEYLGLQHTVKNTESRLNDLRKKLDAFNASAAKAGVPPNVME